MKVKKIAVEAFKQQDLEKIITKTIKKRLKYLKKKPNKNYLGIRRLEEELDRRAALEADMGYITDEDFYDFKDEEDFEDFLDSLDDEFDDLDDEDDFEKELDKLIEEMPFKLEEEDEFFITHDDALERVREMKKVLENKVRNEPDFALRVRMDSNKLKVLAELRYINDDRIYGYMVQNISPELLELEHFADEKYLSFMAGNSREVLCTGEVKIIELTTFVAMMAQEEFSFTVANGYIKSSIPLEEVLRQEKELGRDIILSNYLVVPKKDAEPIPIIYIE